MPGERDDDPLIHYNNTISTARNPAARTRRPHRRTISRPCQAPTTHDLLWGRLPPLCSGKIPLSWLMGHPRAMRRDRCDTHYNTYELPLVLHQGSDPNPKLVYSSVDTTTTTTITTALLSTGFLLRNAQSSTPTFARYLCWLPGDAHALQSRIHYLVDILRYLPSACRVWGTVVALPTILGG